MTNSAYKRRNAFIRRNYANVVATLALFVALTGVGLVQAGVIVTSKQIRNGTILSQDIHKAGVKSTDIATGGVQSTDIQTGAVDSSDIGDGQVTSGDVGEGQINSGDIGQGQVTPGDVTMPDPEQIEEADAATVNVGTDYALVDSVGSYSKEDPGSVLEVDWTGTAAAPTVSCTFQLRVDGQASPGGGGSVFVQLGNSISVSATALFPDLGAGAHTIEVWAKAKTGEGMTDKCTVGPASAGIPQSFVVSEQVV